MIAQIVAAAIATKKALEKKHIEKKSKKVTKPKLKKEEPIKIKITRL